MVISYGKSKPYQLVIQLLGMNYKETININLLI